MNIHSAVVDRYSRGAMDVQPGLCCPVSYDNSLLTLLPEEIVSEDYGCGDSSQNEMARDRCKGPRIMSSPHSDQSIDA